MNLLIDRWRYDLGGVVSGPDDAPLTICPRWSGPPPPAAPFTIASVRGCDIAPIDGTDVQAARRLRAYIWPEATARFERLDAGIAMLRATPVNLVRADAADWVEAQFMLPQAEGVARVLMHSTVWQYLPPVTQARIDDTMAIAAARATPAAPLAWVALETDRQTMRHRLTVRAWPVQPVAVVLAESHAHCEWVSWLA